MTPEAWLTAAVVLGVLVGLARELAPPVLIIITAVVVLLLVDVITTEQALAGFANPAPLTVAALYVLARAVQRTGGVGAAVEAVLGGRGGSPVRMRPVLGRMMGSVMAASSVLNNTPVVAIVAPGLSSWAEERGISASTFLIPLSYAAILGGILTAIGTSTTLVVSGLLQQSGRPPIALLEPFSIAWPVAVAGAVTTAALAPLMIPQRRPAHLSFASGRKSFTLSLRVLEDGPVSGQTIAQAGLRALRGVYCVQVRRGVRVIAPVAPDLELAPEDELTFVGDVHRVVDLQHRRGLASTEAHHTALVGQGQRFYEAVIGPSSSLVGATLKRAGFRAAFSAAVVAIHRAGEPLEQKLGEVPLRVGDTLLCIAGPGFAQRAEDSGDFVLVAALGAEAPLDGRSTRLVSLISGLLLLTVGLGWLSILEGSLAAAVALVLTRVMSADQARRAIDVPVIIVIAASFGLGAAVESSGLADILARGVLAASMPLGTAGLTVGIVLLVVLLTEVITNNAAAVLAFPVVQAAATAAGVPDRPLLIGVAIAASLSFITPLGYQTNLMVYGLGGYRFSDFARIGIPVSLVANGVLCLMLLR